MEEQYLINGYVQRLQRVQRFFTFQILKRAILFLTTISVIIACIVSTVHIAKLTYRNYHPIGPPQIEWVSNSNAQLNLCETPECIAVSNQLLSYMDPSADPCDDFYQYACGGWINDHKDSNILFSTVDVVQEMVDRKLRNLLDSHWMTKDFSMSILFRQLKAYYYSCLHDTGSKESDVKLMVEFINKVIATNASVDGSLTDLLTYILKFTPFPFLNLDINGYDERQTDGLIIKIAPADFLTIKTEEELITNTSDKFNLMREITKEICAQQNISYKSFASELQNFETEVQMLYIQANASNKTKIKLRDLQNLFGTVFWTHLLANLYEYEFHDDDKVEIEDVDYMISLNKLLEKYINRNIHALLAIYISKQAVTLTEMPKSPDVCLKFTKAVFPFSLSEIFLASESNKFLLSVKDDAELIFGELRDSLISLINNCQWMARETKRNFLQKVLNIESYFGDLKIDASDWYFFDLGQIEMKPNGFLENTLTVIPFNLQSSREFYKNYKSEGVKSKSQFGIFYAIDHFGWYMANAFYHPTTNQIFFPLGYLNPPNYFPNVPKYVTFGNLGFVTAHEMFHGFDVLGIKYDKRGNVFGLLETQTDEIAYNERIECFTDWYWEHFEQITTKIGINETLRLNKIATLKEYVADSGISLAYKAYKSWSLSNPMEQSLPGISLKNDKVFYLSAVQLFCSTVGLNYNPKLEGTSKRTPSPERINIMLMNSENFSAVFQCSSLSRMNRKNRCSIW